MSKKKYLFTELYKNEIKITSIKIDKQEMISSEYNFKKMKVFRPGRSIFVYRAEDENDDKKELCLVFWRTTSPVMT